MISFIDEVFKIKFDEQPNYDKLKFNLVKILLDLNQTPNKVYDWNEDYMMQKSMKGSTNLEEERKQSDKVNTKMFDSENA